MCIIRKSTSAVLLICSCGTKRVGHILVWGYMADRGLEEGSHVALCFCDEGQIHGAHMFQSVFPLAYLHKHTDTTVDLNKNTGLNCRF